MVADAFLVHILNSSFGLFLVVLLLGLSLDHDLL
nr:MAG TPA: hypothetical protein [Inoviridae sp.]